MAVHTLTPVCDKSLDASHLLFSIFYNLFYFKSSQRPLIDSCRKILHLLQHFMLALSVDISYSQVVSYKTKYIQFHLTLFNIYTRQFYLITILLMMLLYKINKQKTNPRFSTKRHFSKPLTLPRDAALYWPPSVVLNFLSYPITLFSLNAF